MKNICLRDGRNIIIREAVKEDADRIIDYINKVSAESDYLTFEQGEFNVSVDEEEKVIERSRKADNRLFLVAYLDGEIVGSLNFNGGERSRIRHMGEFGVSVLKEYWHLGIGESLILFLLKWCSDSKVIRKINLKVREDHRVGIKLYEKLGFKKEGIITRYFCMNDNFYDAILMGMQID